MTSGPEKRTAAATAALLRRTDDKIAARLISHGWTVIEPKAQATARRPWAFAAPNELPPAERLTQAAEELERLDRRATHGPWTRSSHPDLLCITVNAAGRTLALLARTDAKYSAHPDEDAELIVAARPLLNLAAAWLREEATRCDSRALEPALAFADAVLSTAAAGRGYPRC